MSMLLILAETRKRRGMTYKFPQATFYWACGTTTSCESLTAYPGLGKSST